MTTHHTFLESRHPEVTKNTYYVLSPEGSQKMYQLMDYVSVDFVFWSVIFFKFESQWTGLWTQELDAGLWKLDSEPWTLNARLWFIWIRTFQILPKRQIQRIHCSNLSQPYQILWYLDTFVQLLSERRG